jgi:hypothetical protein
MKFARPGALGRGCRRIGGIALLDPETFIATTQLGPRSHRPHGSLTLQSTVPSLDIPDLPHEISVTTPY